MKNEAEIRIAAIHSIIALYAYFEVEVGKEIFSSTSSQYVVNTIVIWSRDGLVFLYKLSLQTNYTKYSSSQRVYMLYILLQPFCMFWILQLRFFLFINDKKIRHDLKNNSANFLCKSPSFFKLFFLTQCHLGRCKAICFLFL